MGINKSKVIIRPENPSEYEEVNKLIYEAFAEQHGIETGKFMMEHFIGERQKNLLFPNFLFNKKWKNYTTNFIAKCCFTRI